MLTEESAAVVRATLPAVGEALGGITERFYARMFAAHPELERTLFNRAHQATGAQREALAGAIAAFAGALVTRPHRSPDALLGRIAHKHASLGIGAGQYRVVHTHLFAAIGDALGDAVTPEVAAAWDEVYWLMANSLIRAERDLYARHGVLLGDTWRPWRVVGRVQETADVISLELRPADGAAAPEFTAGQYVSVRVELPDGAQQIRQYSLTGTAGTESRRITVKRVPAGSGPAAETPREASGEASPAGEVSGYLHDRVRQGDVVELSAPYGDVVLRDTGAPLLLASAGIGCTPVIAMLEQLVRDGHRGPVVVVHGDRSPADHALRDEHLALVGKLGDGQAHFWYEHGRGAAVGDRTGLVDLAAITLPAGPLDAYLCGPLPFMRTVRERLRDAGVPAERIHYEVFGPDLWQGRD
ncbi:globin domain-containing protein [Streptomyces hebeiensis]